jgi:signal transduction histidine kinase
MCPFGSEMRGNSPRDVEKSGNRSPMFAIVWVQRGFSTRDGHGLTLAEHSILPDVDFDVQQAAQFLDHTAWSAIAVAEAEIVACAGAQTAAGVCAPTASSVEAAIGLTLRSLEGVLHFGRPSFGARDLAWALATQQPGTGTSDGPDIVAVYDAVLDAIGRVAPAAEEAARGAARQILDEAAIIAGQDSDASWEPVDVSLPIPPLAFRGLADLPHVAYVVDRSLRFAYVNQAWEAFARDNGGDGCLAPDVVGRSWLETIAGPDREHWLAVAEQILAGVQPSYSEEIPCHAPSACRFIVVTASPLRLAEDDLEVAGVVFVTYDVTELRRAEIERLWLDQEGRRMRDVFVGTVAHDLRNPLTAIKGRAQLLRLRAANAETRLRASLEDSLAAIEATADQMAGQIEELLDAAQIQAGQPIPLRTRQTDLATLLRGVMKAHEHLLAGHRLRLQATDEQILGLWDAVRIRRVAANLISNAIKYSPDGGEIVVTVQREQAASHTWAAFSVQDQGIGIPAADLPRIFSSFFRGSNVDAETDGVGLGLAGAHQIVTQHGGEIEVTSEVGVGTTFTVRLPLMDA